jgi:hypothetical protein
MAERRPPFTREAGDVDEVEPDVGAGDMQSSSLAEW